MKNRDHAKPFERRLRRWQWATVAVLFVGYAGYYVCRSNFSALLPRIADDMASPQVSRDSAKEQLGDVASLGTFAYALGKFVAGGLADRLGGRRFFLAGMLGSVGFTILFASGRSLPVYGVSWVGNRFVQAFGWVGLVKIVSRWFSPARYGTAMGFISASYLFGDWIARKGVGILVGRGLSWNTIFMVAAGILATLAIITKFVLRETPADRGLLEPPADSQSVYGDDDSSRVLLGPLLRSRVFLLACGLSLGFTLMREAFSTWTTEYFQKGLGLSLAEAADRSSWFPLLAGISVVLAGILGDRIGKTGRAAVLFFGLVLTGIALSILGVVDFSKSATPAVALVTFIGFVMIGPYSYLAGSTALDFGGKRGSATAAGWIDGIGYLGGILAGGSLARVSTRFGWQGAFLSLAAIAWVSSIIAVAFWIDQRRRNSTSTQ